VSKEAKVATLEHMDSGSSSDDESFSVGEFIKRLFRRNRRPHPQFARTEFVEPTQRLHPTEEQNDLILDLRSFLKTECQLSNDNTNAVVSVLARLILGEGIQFKNQDEDEQRRNGQPMRFMDGVELLITGDDAQYPTIVEDAKAWLGSANSALNGWGSSHPLQKFLQYREFILHISRPRMSASQTPHQNTDMNPEGVHDGQYSSRDYVSTMSRLGYANDCQCTIRGMKHTRPGSGKLWFGLIERENGPVIDGGAYVVVHLTMREKNKVWEIVKWRDVRMYLFPVWLKKTGANGWSYMGRYRMLPFTRRKTNTVIRNGVPYTRDLEKCLERVDRHLPFASDENMAADPQSWPLERMDVVEREKQCFPPTFDMPDEEAAPGGGAGPSSVSTREHMDLSVTDDDTDETEQDSVVAEVDTQRSRKRALTMYGPAAAARRTRYEEDVAELTARFEDDMAEIRAAEQRQQLRREQVRKQHKRNVGLLEESDRTAPREGCIVHYDTEQRLATAPLIDLFLTHIDTECVLKYEYKCTHTDGGVHEHRTTHMEVTHSPDLYVSGVSGVDDLCELTVVAECKADVSSSSVFKALGQLMFQQEAFASCLTEEGPHGFFVACYPREPAPAYQTIHANCGQCVWWPGKGHNEPWIRSLRELLLADSLVNDGRLELLPHGE
jgi:hypothetical protein